jgi:hypothetical protein
MNLDIRPSYLLVGEEDAPVEFDWSSEVFL